MRSERIQMGNDIAKILTSASFIYFVSYKGLKVKDLTQFRDKLTTAGAECHILKNRVVRKIAELNGIKSLAETKISGDTALVIGAGDPGPVAKIVDDFSKDTKGVLAAKCGYFEGSMLSAKDVADIAGLPSKDVLRAQLLGLLVSVPTSLVTVLNAKASSIVNVINAYKNKLEKAN